MTQKVTLQQLLFFALILTTIAACQKTEDLIDPPSTGELLADGAWVLKAQTVDPAIEVNGVMISNEYNQIPSCTRDDLYNFNESGSYTLEEGATKCATNDPQIIETGSWLYQEDNAFFQLLANNTPFNLTLTTLNRDEMVWVQTWIDNGVNYTRTYTLESE
ncbi:MAG: hypothetical protein AAFV80_14705 [Bacteroidota bacterium]